MSRAAHELPGHVARRADRLVREVERYLAVIALFDAEGVPPFAAERRLGGAASGVARALTALGGKENR